MDGMMATIHGDGYTVKFNDTTFANFYEDAIQFVVTLLSITIKYVEKETSVDINTVNDNNNQTTSIQNESDDVDDGRFKVEQLQKERHLHN
jgi:hypothetical protein